MVNLQCKKPHPTGHYNGGDAKKRMATVTKMIDGKTKMGLLSEIPGSVQTQTHVRLPSGC